jgi:hypothetical protein
MHQQINADGDINDAHQDSPPQSTAMVMADVPGVGEVHRASKYEQPAQQEHDCCPENLRHDDGEKADYDHEHTDDDGPFGRTMDEFVGIHILVMCSSESTCRWTFLDFRSAAAKRKHFILNAKAQNLRFNQVHLWLKSLMDLSELAKVLVALGCPADKSNEMAAQLDKRAKQLVELKGKSYDEALRHLLVLMQQGWAAKEKGQ